MTTTTSAMQLTALPTVQVSTLIRRPPAEVFAAFTDPAITTRFWFTKSSGTLAPRRVPAAAPFRGMKLRSEGRVVVRWSA